MKLITGNFGKYWKCFSNIGTLTCMFILYFMVIALCDYTCKSSFLGLTSSSLIVIIVKALNTHSVAPVMVMILSGHEPSEMLIRALLCIDRIVKAH